MVRTDVLPSRGPRAAYQPDPGGVSQMHIDEAAERAAIARTLEELEGAVGARARAVPAGSTWSVVQHAEHVGITLERTLKALAILSAREGKLAPDAQAEPLGDLARSVLESERIRSFTAQAPAPTVPAEAPDPDAVVRQLRSLQETVSNHTPIRSTRGTIPHPALGPLDALAWLRFIRIHGEHHHRLLGARDPA